jgi:hypothetical protein
MAVGVLVNTVVFDRDLYKPGHMVNKWVHLVTQRFTSHAKDIAPHRSGELRAGISGSARQVGSRQVEGIIASRANHTMFVLRGTTGPIRTTRAFANPEGAYSELWGSIDPKTGKFTRRHIKGAERTRHKVRNKGYWLRVRAGNGYGQHIAFQVNGQEANNFLLAAWRRTAINHKAIRGKTPTFILHP